MDVLPVAPFAPVSTVGGVDPFTPRFDLALLLARLDGWGSAASGVAETLVEDDGSSGALATDDGDSDAEARDL